VPDHPSRKPPDRVYWRAPLTGRRFLQRLPIDLMAEPTIPRAILKPPRRLRPSPSLLRSRRAQMASWRKFSCDGSKYANVDDGWMGIASSKPAQKHGQEGLDGPAESDLMSRRLWDETSDYLTRIEFPCQRRRHSFGTPPGCRENVRVVKHTRRPAERRG